MQGKTLHPAYITVIKILRSLSFSPMDRDRHSDLVALRLRSLRFHSPRLCRVAVFLIQTNVSLGLCIPSTNAPLYLWSFINSGFNPTLWVAPQPTLRCNTI